MLGPANLVRGAVLKCQFPFDSHPDRPGPWPHYCLYIDSVDSEAGIRYVAVCYGTSRLDDVLMRAREGAILSVSSQYIAGSELPGPVSHFVASHVAILPEDWIYSNFFARLDFIRPEKRSTDARRQRLFEQFVALEPVMASAALDALHYTLKSGRPGLPPGRHLR